MAKGQGLSFNVIIFMVIALLVLAVLIFVITRYSGRFITGTESCTAKGGECAHTREDGKCSLNESVLLLDECKTESDEQGKCCIPLLT